MPGLTISHANAASPTASSAPCSLRPPAWLLLLLLLLPLLALAQDEGLERADALLGPAPHEALEIAREVREDAAAGGDEARVAQARIRAARALSALNAGDEAVAEIGLALDWLERNGSDGVVAQALKTAGDLHLAANDHEAALGAYQSAQTRFERAGDARGVAEVLSATGTLFFYQERHDDAHAYYSQAKAAFERAGDLDGAGRQLANLGIIHTTRGDFDQALAAYRESLALMERLGKRRSVARILNNIGATYERKGEPDNVVHWYERALAEYEAINDRQGIAETLSNLGLIAATLDRPEEARRHLERARGLASDIGNLRALESASLELAALEEAQGRPAEALALLRGASEARDQRISQERAEQIERMRARFDNARKERELATLQEQRRTQRMVTGFGAVLVLALLGILAMVVHRYRANQRVARIMQQKNAALEQLQQELKEAAATDYLTGVLNRRAFLPILEHELARLVRNTESFSLLMLDIDHFKKINDTYGHEAGDAVIRGVVDRVCSALRGQDVVCRWGGEEFVVVLPATGAAGARVVAEKLRSAIAANPVEVDGQRIEITMTIGGMVDPHAGDAVHDVVDRADAALYRGKREGRNRVRLDDEEGDGNATVQ